MKSIYSNIRPTNIVFTNVAIRIWDDPATLWGDCLRAARRAAKEAANDNRALTVEGFSPQISVTREQRSSTAQLHVYERIFGELRFVRLFRGAEAVQRPPDLRQRVALRTGRPRV